jgi:uncharacterized membrane protein
MAPLIVLIAAFLVFLVLGRFRVKPLRDWLTALRWALAVMFLFTSTAHFGPMRADLVRMVPPALPDPELLVTVTGVLEILGAIGLFIPRFAPWAAGGLVLLLMVLFPANVHAAREAMTIGGRPATPLVPRLLLQLLFIFLLLVAGFGPRIRELRRLRAS